jgi:uncharacterized membrane protein
MEIQKQLEQLHHDVNAMRQAQNNMITLSNERNLETQQKVSELSQGVLRLITLVEGDKSQPHLGYGSRLKQIEDRQDRLERKQFNITAVGFVIGTAIGFIMSNLDKITHFFSRHQ